MTKGMETSDQKLTSFQEQVLFQGIIQGTFNTQ